MAKVNVANSLVVTAEMRAAPYYNDWNEDKNYHALGFRPEYAVQARELTSLQSILQNQIERFGQHMFVNGTPILGAGIDFLKVTTLNLQSSFNGTDIDINEFANTRVQYTSNTNVLGEVIAVSEANANEPHNIFLRYTTGDDFGPGDTIRVSGSTTYANVMPSANAIANGFAAFIQDSVYFVDGYFIKVPRQTVIVSKYKFANTNIIIGLEKNKTIVTENEDPSLLDPAAESSNYDAPGAARFKFELNLTTRPLDTEDLEEFIELARFEDGVLTNRVINTQYAELEETLARRTYDESGNYTVRPFLGNVIEKDNDEVYLTLSPGKAYIQGFEYETISETKLAIPKAREKANTIENYDLNMNFGNYVIVDNVAGFFDGTTMELIDMHCLPFGSVNLTNSNGYNTTKIGSARVVDLNFYGGDSNTVLRKHELYIADTRFSNLSSNISNASTSTVTFNSGDTRAVDHAYVNTTIRIISGLGAGYIGRITSYNGANRLATVNPPFTTVPNNSSRYRIEFSFQDVESFVKHTNFTTGATANANANITLLNKRYKLGQEGIQYGAPAFISEPSLNKLIFSYPNQFVANGIVTNSFFYRRKYTGVQFTDGVSSAITAGATEDFEGATTSSPIASTVMDNFFIVIDDKKSASGRSNGEQVSAAVTVSGAPEQAIFDTGFGAGDTFTATVFAKMETSGAGAVARVKTLVKANTKTRASYTANGTFIKNGSVTYVYLNDGQVMIINPSKSTTVKQSLYLSDVNKIVKIYNCNGTTPGAGANLQSYADVTSYYSFDNGQRASYYDHASITLKPGYTAPKGPLVVCTRYFKTTSDSGYFNVDSYPSLNDDITEEGINIGTGYALIPTFEDIPLRDAIDFRPVRQNASNTEPNFSLQGVKTPTPVTDLQSDYSYYLGRKDLVVAMPNRTIEVIEGDYSLNPQFPTVPGVGMILYRLTIPPYTLSAANVIAQYVENKRYTMRDIGLLDQRLKNVEYYVSLNLLEKSAFDLNIVDQNGLPRTKYGILAENFTGHELGDANRDDYVVAVDLQGKIYKGRAVPTTNVSSSPMSLTGARDNVVFNGNRYASLTYNVAPLFASGGATRSMDPGVMGDFIGIMTTVPDADIYYDTIYYNLQNTGEQGVGSALPNPRVVSISEPEIGPEIAVTDPDPAEPTDALPPNPIQTTNGKPSASVPVIHPVRSGEVGSF